MDWLINTNSDEIIGKILANHSLLSALALVVVGWILGRVLPKDLYQKIAEVWSKWRKPAE